MPKRTREVAEDMVVALHGEIDRMAGKCREFDAEFIAVASIACEGGHAMRLVCDTQNVAEMVGNLLATFAIRENTDPKALGLLVMAYTTAQYKQMRGKS
jgi:hypothetical protein